jgi:ATP-dependent RNA helicase DDX3X
MTDWGTTDLATALPDNAAPSIEVTDATPKVDPQAHGWVERTAYDYTAYNKSGKELQNAQADGEAPKVDAHYGAVGGIAVGDWASNGAVYEWNDEYGEIGPSFKELELQLFGSDNHVKSGLEFDK